MAYPNDSLTFGELKGLRLHSDVLMDRNTGKAILDNQHLKNCLVDILTTPIGTRVMLREYGSKLFQLIDRPINRDLIVELYATIHVAISRWEPRLLVTKLLIDAANWGAGQLTISLEAHSLLENGPIRINDLSLDFMVQNQYFIADPENRVSNPFEVSFGDLAAQAPDSLVLAGAGDIGLAGAIQSQQAELMFSFNPEYLLLPGDLNYEDGRMSTIFANTAVFNDYIAKGKVFPAIGNHENAGSGSVLPHVRRYSYLPGNKRYYTQTLWGGKLTLIVINTGYDSSRNLTLEPDGSNAGSKQHLWVLEQLEKCTSEYVIVMGHHPFASQVTSGANQVFTGLSWIKNLPKVQLYFHGHSHTAQHNIYAPGGAIQMHVLDVSAGPRSVRNMSSGQTLAGASTDMQHVWGYAAPGQSGPTCVARFVLTKEFMLVEVYDSTTGSPIHSFTIQPWK